MAKKKNEPQQTTAGQQLEDRVDAMMDPKREEQVVTAQQAEPGTEPANQQPAEDLPPLDIFADPATAPDVPKDLLKNLDAVVQEPVKKSASKKSTPQPAASDTETKAPGPEEPQPADSDNETQGPKAEAAPQEAEEPASEPDTPDPKLDDATSDAAVDEIVAQEGDMVLKAEDEAAQEPAPAPQPQKKKHHPVFWTLVFVLVVLIMLAVFLLATGGNVKAPGLKGAQSTWQLLRKNL